LYLAALKTASKALENLYSVVLPQALGLDTVKDTHEFRSMELLTTLGRINYTRAYTQKTDCNGKTVREFPLDKALGITHGCTVAMASLMTWAGASYASYEKASESFMRFSGVDVSGRRIHRLVNAVSVAQTKWISSRKTQDEKVDILNIQADMTGIRMRAEDLHGVKGQSGADPKKCQIKVGAIFRQQKNSQGEIQRVYNSTTHVATFSDVSKFSQMLLNEAKKRGYYNAETVVFTSDGAEWIWKMAEDRFKGCVQIVDFYHAAEHLSKLCAIVEPDENKFRKFFHARKLILRDYGVDSTIEYFTKAALNHCKESEIKAELHYFITNQTRMQYKTFKEKHYFIGSGVIEGTCKNLVNQRTDLGGQRWLKKYALNVINIRAAVQDNLHDSYWQSIAKSQSKTG
jgi:hypothetical protein